MDRKEARLLLGQHLNELEALGYSGLSRRVGQDEVFEQQGLSNARYQLEVMVRWEHKPEGAILILGTIDDGGLSAFLPLSDSRIVHPETRPPEQ